MGKSKKDACMNIYNRMLADVINEATCFELRKIINLPWIQVTDTKISIEELIDKTKAKLEAWVLIGAGKIPDSSFLTYMKNLNEDKLQHIREENLKKLLFSDIEESDFDSNFPYFYDTSIVLDIEKEILDDIVVETFDFL